MEKIDTDYSDNELEKITEQSVLHARDIRWL